MEELMFHVPSLNVQFIFLIVLQLATIPVLWFVNPLSQSATDAFALYLSLDLLAFAIVSYAYRTTRWGKSVSQAWMAVGYLALIVLLVSTLAIL
ncbi:MAG TPA: hypothetical protein VGR56_00375 [Nitrososphaerales archaeon]|nr:hypothetical protein [Nitrososphaerales archaeon]